MNSNKVSIIVPCFNQAEYLDESIQSVLDQTYVNWECIIVNDGSLDKTEEVAKRWVAKDNRFSYLFQENTGICGARNYGVKQATGEFILPLDADDKLGSDYISLGIKEFNNDKSVCLVYANAYLFGAENKIWNLADFEFNKFLLHNCIYSSAIFRKVDFLAVNGYDEEMKYGLEDWEFWISILSLYEIPKVKKIDYLGFFYRIKEKSRNAVLFDDTNKEGQMISVICRKHYLLYEKKFGSYIAVVNNLDQNIKETDYQLKSEKFVLDVFCKTFFGFTIFNKYRKG
ncbi:glycosyltransferase family 2 protein [Flavobacterium sp. ZS1P14]|uniref:glycosyltransferase family 2 protein n=1 Tax=Flavobacterium sp. ZS1P14 TaxID=3401729 RepID=UPI003AAA7A52